MIFNDQDIRANQPRTLDQTRASFATDRRWQGVPDDVTVIDSTRVHESRHSTKES